MGKFGFRRRMDTTQREVRQMFFIVDGTGTAALTLGSTDGTLVDNGAGDYTITFNEAFTRAPVCVGTPLTTGTVVEISTATTTLVTINTFDTATGGTPTDSDFHLIVTGFDSSDEV